MAEMEKQSIGEVNEIYERYCFNKRDKLPTGSVDCFVVELKTLAKTCNFCDCLHDSLIRDRNVLEIKDEQTTKKFLRIRDLPLNRCIDICRSEEVTALHMKSLSELVDNINQVKSKKKKPRLRTDSRERKLHASFVAKNTLLRERRSSVGQNVKEV